MSHFTVSLPNRDITTSPFSKSSLTKPDAGADLSICPGARIAGLGGPWGWIKRTKTINSAIAVLIRTRRVICRLAMVFGIKGGGSGVAKVNCGGHQTN